MKISVVSTEDNFEAICAQMQPGEWGKDNEMTSYQPEKLRKYLGGENTLLLLAKDGEKIAAAALCYVLPHPAGKDSLYVHELDTHSDYRRQGVARQMMQELQKIAAKKGLKEIWLGTETDNDAANAFYKSLSPSEIEPSVVYAYKVE